MAAQAEMTAIEEITPQPLSMGPSFVIREVMDRETWDGFVTSAPNGHLLQGWSWGEYKRHAGWIPVRLAVARGDEILAAAQLLIRRAFGLGFGYVPRGPVCDPAETEIYLALLDALDQRAREHRCVFLRVEPNEGIGSDVDRVLRQHGFVLGPEGMRPQQPLATFNVDLSGGAEAVLAGMRKRTREYVRSAGRRLNVRYGSGESDVALFHSMMVELASRKNVTAKPIDYYHSLLDELSPHGEATLLLAEHEEEAIAGLIVLAYGEEGTFSHSAALGAKLNLHANQLLQWKAMEWCMQRGCTRYDLGGVFDARITGKDGRTVYLPVDPEAMEGEERGLFLYKQQYGGTLVRYPGAYDIAHVQPLYLLWRKLARLQGIGTDWLHGGMSRAQASRDQVRRYLSRPERGKQASDDGAQ